MRRLKNSDVFGFNYFCSDNKSFFSRLTNLSILRCFLISVFIGSLLHFSSITFASPFKLHDKGTEDIVNYEKYGEFIDIGKNSYSYKINDLSGLRRAVGEGIYPNVQSVYKDPQHLN